MLRIGAINLTIGNVLGSNLYKVLILGIDDLFYLPGSLYSDVEPGHLGSALVAAVMSGAVIVGIFYRSPARLAGTTSWISLLLLTLFAVNGWMLYHPGQAHG